MQYLIETPRLYIRELLPEDEEGMFAMDSDPEVHRYLGNNPVTTREQIAAVITMIRQQYADYGIGRWAVLDKANNEFLGWTGFRYMVDMVNGHVHHYDFGYRLAHKAWGKGIATEASKASLEYGLNTLKLQPVHAMTDVDNAASRRVLEKLGFRFVKEFLYDGPVALHVEDNLMTTWYEWPH